MKKLHTRKYGSESLTIQVDLAQPSAPILRTWDDPSEGLHSKPFQTADARHNLNEAFRLCREWEG